MTVQMEPVRLSRPDADAPGLLRHRAVVDRREFSVTYRVSEKEHQRRQSLGTGAVTSSRTLAALLALPQFTLGEVTPLLADVFDKPTTNSMALIIDDPDQVRWGMRLLAAPLEIVEIEVSARSWARGRETVHPLVGLGPRVVRLEGRLPRNRGFALTEASHYGIGIVSSDSELVLAPGNGASVDWNVGRWRFTEIVYSQFLDLTSRSSTM